MPSNEPTLIVGTGNAKKRDEIVELLQLPDLRLLTLRDLGDQPIPEVVEDGTTFLENAEKKATILATALEMWVLGEDSGLVVPALDGAPGIYSARFAGEPCDDERNNDELLRRLEGVPEDGRSAYYVCTAVVAGPTGAPRAAGTGKCHGRITTERRGSNGFGYDPLFEVPELGGTFGELPPAVKRQHSHRAAALAKLRPRLQDLLLGRA